MLDRVVVHEGFAMRFALVAGMLLLMSGASFAEAARFKIADGKFIVAQGYCGICADSNRSCQLGCNGSGACIQACDLEYRDCLRQNFCGRR
jgi:hypothetical protein